MAAGKCRQVGVGAGDSKSFSIPHTACLPSSLTMLGTPSESPSRVVNLKIRLVKVQVFAAMTDN